MSARLLAGRYELGAELGRGGMAIVHRARDRLLARDVAVKLLTDRTSRERLLAEARRTAQLRHPNVVDVLDVGEDGGDVFLVMELLEGEPLASLLEREPRLPPPTAVGIARKICAGLAAAHARGLVHRDIKPANVFLGAADESGVPKVKILDFGVAKREGGSTIETEPGLMVGTFAFMAPEQIKGEPLDGRADLYALGVTLFRMLAGRLPFEQDTAASLVFAHLSTPAPRLPDADDDVTMSRLDRVVRRLLSKSADDRPADAERTGEEITRALEASETTREIDASAELSDPVSFEIDRGPDIPSTGPSMRPPTALPSTPLERWPSPPPARLPPQASSRSRALSALGVLPKPISKRVAGYSALGLVLSVVFFSPPVSVIVLLSLLTIAGFLSWLAPES